MLGEKVKSLLRGCAAGSGAQHVFGLGPFPGDLPWNQAAFLKIPPAAEPLVEVIHRGWPLAQPDVLQFIMRAALNGRRRLGAPCKQAWYAGMGPPQLRWLGGPSWDGVNTERTVEAEARCLLTYALPEVAAGLGTYQLRLLVQTAWSRHLAAKKRGEADGLQH